MGLSGLNRQRGNTLLHCYNKMAEAATTSWTGGTRTRGWGYQNGGAAGKDPGMLGTQAVREDMVCLLLWELRGGAAPRWAGGGGGGSRYF